MRPTVPSLGHPVEIDRLDSMIRLKLDEMAKRSATSHQLEQMISDRMGGASVFVRRDTIHGWTATLVASPSQILALNAELQQIVDALRGQFDLAK